MVPVGVRAQRHGDRAGRRVLAAIVQHHLLTGFGGLQQRGELVQGGGRLAVDGVDGVADLQLALRRPLSLTCATVTAGAGTSGSPARRRRRCPPES